jgi:hypothetical protein
VKQDRNNHIRVYFQPAFLICAAVLAIAASTMSIAIKAFGVVLQKEPLPLKKSLDLLDENALAPYKVVAKHKIGDERVVKGLGTEDYIQWDLEDPEAPADCAVRRCELFITYYKHPDPRVVHIPDECYMGVGYQRLASDSVLLEVNRAGTKEEHSARYLVFSGQHSGLWQQSMKFPVLYLFHVNGRYAGSREEARIILNKNLFGKYSYFSKVEWKFYNTRLDTRIYPNKEEAVKASRKLLGVILPILEGEHWPDFEKQ